MPLLQVSRNRGVPPPPTSTNNYQAELIALGADRVYVFDEIALTTSQNVANPGVNDVSMVRNSALGLMQAIVGPVRGTPRVKGIASVFAGRAQDGTGNAAVTGYTGVLGGWFKIGARVASAEDNVFMSCTYDANTARTWFFGVYTPGSVVVYMEGAGNGYRWVWNASAIVEQWKRNPSDTYVDGDIWNFMAIVQRGDGTGPKLFMNGTEYSYDVRVTIGAGAPEGDDYWCGYVHDDVIAVNPSAAAEVRVLDPRGRPGFNPTFNQVGAGAFIFDGTALSVAQLNSIYSASNLNGLVSDYMEFVQNNRGGPSWWMTYDVATSLSDTQLVVPTTAQNLDDVDHSTVTSWAVSETSREISGNVALPGTWSTDYQKVGTLYPNAGGARRSERVINANSWTTANGFDEGTLCIMARMISTANRWLFSLAGGLGSGPSVAPDRLNLRTISGGDLRMDRAVAGGDVQTVMTASGGLASGQDFMLVFVMRKDGNPMEVYLNGSPLTVSETVDPGADPEMWIGEMVDATIARADQMGLSLGYSNGQFSTLIRWGDNIYDAWICREPWTAGEIKDCWDLLTGAITEAAVS